MDEALMGPQTTSDECTQNPTRVLVFTSQLDDRSRLRFINSNTCHA
jgi:hypothetical protein